MGEPFVENGCEAVNYLTEKYWDRGFDAVTRAFGITPKLTAAGKTVVERDKKQKWKSAEKRGGSVNLGGKKENTAPRATSRSPDKIGGKRHHRSYSDYLSTHPRLSDDTIESWDRERYFEQVRSSQQGGHNYDEEDSSLDRQSEHSDKVIRAYHLDPSDPVRKPADLFLLNTNTNTNPNTATGQRASRDMSYSQNGGLAPGNNYGQGRSNSAQPPRTRGYYDDEEEYGSDYDDRRGSRYQNTGRGYDDRGYDDRGYDDGRGDYREEVVTERYRGPARGWDDRRQSFRSQNDYQGGQLTQYDQYNSNSQQRRSTTDVGYYQGGGSRRSRSRGSRGRRDSERDRSRSRSRSYSRSRSGSRSRSRSGDRGFGGAVGKHFDTSLQGIGVGLAGAVVGGMAGRHFGERNPRHKNRDVLIGALVGGLGANAAEKQWTHWQDEKKEKLERDEERWEGRYDDARSDYRRSRSAMR